MAAEAKLLAALVRLQAHVRRRAACVRVVDLRVKVRVQVSASCYSFCRKIFVLLTNGVSAIKFCIRV